MWGTGEARFGGLYAAEVHTVDNAGRVQVSVPSVFDSPDSDALVWARPCFPWAHYYLPQAGDKLWVAFENGDPGSPVWIGVWYASGALPPQADAGKPLQRVIGTPKQNLVVLDDTDGNESVTVTDKSGNTVQLTGSGIVITSVSDLTITSSGDLTIDASGHTVTIRAQEVNVEQG